MEKSNWRPLFHTFRPRDPCGPPMGLGRMSARDVWRYEQSLLRFNKKYGAPPKLISGEIGWFEEFVFIERTP